MTTILRTTLLKSLHHPSSKKITTTTTTRSRSLIRSLVGSQQHQITNHRHLSPSPITHSSSSSSSSSSSHSLFHTTSHNTTKITNPSSSPSSSPKTTTTPTTTTKTIDRTTISGPHGSYLSEYTRSITNPQDFWLEHALSSLHWHKPPTIALEKTKNSSSEHHHHHPQWFPDGQINICYNALDRHVLAGRGDQIALVHDSPLLSSSDRKTKKTYTYDELLAHVSLFVDYLKRSCNVTRGDRVVIYMPMIPEAVVAMLACARIGAIHSVVFGGFAAQELAARIRDCRPKVVVSANGGLLPGGVVVRYKPLLDRALEICGEEEGSVERCVIVQREGLGEGEECELKEGRDVDYEEVMKREAVEERGRREVEVLNATDDHFLLYTSGTTGKPKGIIRSVGGYAVALQWAMSHFYHTPPSTVYFSASDIGWVVGHCYIVYGPLLQGCTTILYEGKPVGTPDAGAYWRIIAEHGVRTLFGTPTAFRGIKQMDPEGKLFDDYDTSSLKAVFLAGERADPDTLHWIENVVNRDNSGDERIPVIDHWWQTELCYPGVGNTLGHGIIPPKYGACAGPVCGYDVDVLDDATGKSQEPNTLGNFVIKLPLPPGSLTTIYNDDDRFKREYLDHHPGYYTSGDEAMIDDEGYVHVLGRTDDIINTAGKRLSTGMMEEILLDHPLVADGAVIGVADEIKGEVPMGFVVRIATTTTSDDGDDDMDDETLCRELVQRVRDRLGPVSSFKKVRVVKGLPKTRSGKILRSTMKAIANGKEYVITPTIEDPLIFETLGPEILELVKSE